MYAILILILYVLRVIALFNTFMNNSNHEYYKLLDINITYFYSFINKDLYIPLLMAIEKNKKKQVCKLVKSP